VKQSCVAFIPARSGSKRIPDKNVKKLGNHPILAYTIQAALESHVFDAVICATDSQTYASIATYYGAEAPFLRSVEISGDKSSDIEWVEWMLVKLSEIGRDYEFFSILRPTNPFRSASTIKRAWLAFSSDSKADSLRAVEKCKQHPGKMWQIDGNRMNPIMACKIGSVPWHSSQYQNLPEFYAQNASLEIAKSSVVLDHNSISGEQIVPFITSGFEGFDINMFEDWLLAEQLLAHEKAKLPEISLPPYEN